VSSARRRPKPVEQQVWRWFDHVRRSAIVPTHRAVDAALARRATRPPGADQEEQP
jgi:hypothetical protein